MIKLKRAYDRPSNDDGFRILIDSVWPRGINKEEGKIDLWLRQISPEPGLRKWFHHDPKKFSEFSRRYTEELKNKRVFLSRILDIEKKEETVTLVFGAKDREHNNAVVLQKFLQKESNA